MTAPALGPNFTQNADEYDEEAQSFSKDVWVKGFRDGNTKIRPLMEPERFQTYLEHYADGFGYFPCSRLPDCVGCVSGSDKTKQRQRRWALLALDANGRQQVFKIGKKLRKKFQNRKDSKDTVMDRDYIVTRSGKVFNEIDYDLEADDKYEIVYSEPLFDITAILAAKYTEAVSHFTGLIVEPNTVVTIHDESIGRKVNQEEAAWGVVPEGDPGPAPWETPVDNGSVVTDVPPSAPEISLGDSERPNFDDMSVTQLRDWLLAHSVEFPEREARSRLVKRAEAALV